MMKDAEQLDKEQESGIMLFCAFKDGKEFNGVKKDWNMV